MIDDNAKKKIEDLVNDNYDNVQNFNIDKDDEVHFTLSPRRSRRIGGTGYDLDEIIDLETEDKKIQLELGDAHYETDDDGEDSHPKQYVSVTYRVILNENINTMKHLKLFEDFHVPAESDKVLAGGKVEEILDESNVTKEEIDLHVQGIVNELKGWNTKYGITPLREAIDGLEDIIEEFKVLYPNAR